MQLLKMDQKFRSKFQGRTKKENSDHIVNFLINLLNYLIT